MYYNRKSTSQALAQSCPLRLAPEGGTSQAMALISPLRLAPVGGVFR